MVETSEQQPTTHDDAIEISVPADAAHSSTLRVVVASIGADAGFTVDEIDDLKLAVSEVFGLLTEHSGAPSPRVQARCSTRGSAITIALTRDGVGHLELDPLATAILTSVVDRHELDTDGITMVKSAAEAGT